MNDRIESRPLGQILAEAFRLLRDNWLLTVGVLAVLSVPIRLLGAELSASFNPQRHGPATEAFNAEHLLGGALGVLALLCMTAFLPLAQLVVTAAASNARLGLPVRARSTFARARAAYWAYTGTALLVILAVSPWFVVPLGVLGLAVLLVVLGALPWSPWMLAGLPIALVCFAFGLIFAVRWALIAPVAVSEDAFGRAAMRRSRELVRGHSWRVLGVAAVTSTGGCLSAVLTLALQSRPMLGAVLTGSLDSVSAAFSSAALMVLYADLHGRVGPLDRLAPGDRSEPGGYDGSGNTPTQTLRTV